MEQLISLGQIDSSDTLGSALHHSALHGNKKALKKALEKGIHVDYPNDEGQTPLFCASLRGHDNIVEYLLSAGADPNEKSNLGLTPLHAACYSGNLKILMKLLKEGGDLRLHDYQGRSVKDWAILNQTPKKRMKILEFLDKTRMFAMSNSGQDLLLRKASSKTLHRAHNRRNTVTKIIRERIGRPSIHENLERMASNHHSLGFGHVYATGADTSGFMSAIPLVSENSLRHDNDGETYNNGSFAVMESMWWDYCQVTVKRLHRDLDPFQGGVVDLLINEIEHIGKLRHPNILTLMGVCQTCNLDGMILVYETIKEGSLYVYLHQKMERLPSQMINKLAVQMCDAIIFIHLRGLVHCSVTSHAISIVNTHTFKLGNFEYMIEASKCEWGKKNAVATNTTENAVFNWMAPEVMFSMPPSFYCDMFGFCAVLWEIFHGEVPWNSQCAESIKSNYSKGNCLKVLNGKMQDFYKVILEHGLQQDPTNRQLSFLHVRDLLLAAPKDAQGYIKTHLKHLHPTDRNGNGQQRARDKSLHHSPSPSPSAPPREPGPTSRHIDQGLRDRHTRGDKLQALHLSDERKLRLDTEIGHGKEQGRIDKKQLGEDNRESTRIRSDRFSPKSRMEDNIRVLTHDECNPKKPARQLTYSSDGLSWECLPQQEGEEYLYTVQVKREQSPRKSPHGTLEVNTTQREELESQAQWPSKQTEETASHSDSVDSSTDSSQYARGRPLERKTSSMGNFSFLQLENHLRGRSAAAKPACHGHVETVAEEYSTAGKLTTAGSLYALYNDHSPDLPMGQLERRRDHHHFYTLPQKSQENRVEADPNWFGGKESVRDLAKLFQQQIQEHNHYQSVLDGSVNKQHSSEHIDKSVDKSIYPSIKDYGNNAHEAGKRKRATYDHCESLTKGTKNDKGKEPMEIFNAGELNIHRIAYDVDEESTTSSCCNLDSQMGSNATINSSTESDIVTKWVDHELKKIKRNLSKEVSYKESLPTAGSPELFDKSEDVPVSERHQCTEDSGQMLADSTDSSLDSSRQDMGDHVKLDPFQDFYFDDELYQDETHLAHRSPPSFHPRSYSNNDPHGTSDPNSDLSDDRPTAVNCGLTCNLPTKTIMKTTKSSSDEYGNGSSPCKVRPNKRKSKIPTSTRSNGTSKLTGEAAYANVVTVRSSLDDAGMHQVTHHMKNLETGGSRTLLNDTVAANKVVTKFKVVK